MINRELVIYGLLLGMLLMVSVTMKAKAEGTLPKPSFDSRGRIEYTAKDGSTVIFDARDFDTLYEICK